MEIIKSQSGDTCILAISDRLDTTTAPQLQPELLAAISTGSPVKLDLSHIEYISSAGLRVLLQGQKAAQTAGTVFIVANASPEVKEIFDMTGFSSILQLE